MNRRQFTASLAALVATPALPAIARAPAMAAPAVPPGAYAWAELIARSQNQCSPEMLAKALHLKPGVAKVLFKDMVVDGVLQMPGTSGVANAARPFETTGLEQNATGRLKTKLREFLDDTFAAEGQDADAPALVKQEAPGVDCAEPTAEDPADARSDQHPETRPADG